MRAEHLGHTRQEAIAIFSAQQDVEDAQWEAHRQKVIRDALRKLEAEQAEGNYADNSADTILSERAQAEEEAAKRDRKLIERGRVIQRNQTIRMAREWAAFDRRMGR